MLLVTGGGMGLIPQACAMARALQPAIVVLEDVDLVAEERTRQNKGCNAVLFELLNEMDGLEEDADVVFILFTTNRADLLEPALASRPGRVDQAFEIPAPDAKCRARLLSPSSTAVAWSFHRRTWRPSSSEPVASAPRSSASCSAGPRCSLPMKARRRESRAGTSTRRSTSSSCRAAS